MKKIVLVLASLLLPSIAHAQSALYPPNTSLMGPPTAGPSRFPKPRTIVPADIRTALGAGASYSMPVWLGAGFTSAGPCNTGQVLSWTSSVAVPVCADLTGLHVHPSVVLATTAALPAYTWTAPSGGTLTGVGLGALSIDGTPVVLGMRVLIKDESTGGVACNGNVDNACNGTYTVSQVGDAGNPYILARAADGDTAAEWTGGDAVLVTGGVANISTTWVNGNVVTVLNQDPIVFNELSAPGSNPWLIAGADIYFNAGKVGIGTAAPTQPLDVTGGVPRFRTLASCFNGVQTDVNGLTSCAGAPWTPVADYAADCTGVAGSEAALAAAFAAAPMVMVPHSCILKTAADLTIAQGKTLVLPCGSSISPAVGTTLTFRGTLKVDGLCQVFGVGHALPAGTVAGVLDARPEYWGAYNDDTHDDILPLQAAINNATSTGATDYSRGKLTLSCGAGYRVTVTPGVTVSTDHFLEIAGCGMNPAGNAQAGGIIVSDAGNTVNGLFVTGSAVNFWIHDFHTRVVTDGKGACGISLANVTTNAASISSNIIERVQVGVNSAGTTNGFGDGGICFQDVLEVALRDSTVFLGNKASTKGVSVITDTNGPSGDMKWDNLTIVCSTAAGVATANCATSNLIFMQTTAGACVSPVNCWVQGIHITHSFIYPFTAQQVVFLNARGTALLPDIWFDGVQYDGLSAAAGQVYELLADAGAELDNIQIHNNYFTGGTGNSVSVLYDGGGVGHTNYIDFSHNYVNIGGICAGAAVPVISINGGKEHQIIGNRFTSACNSVGGDIIIGGGAVKTTSVVIEGNTTNCAAAGATASCATASAWFIQTGANASGVSIYNNACYYGNKATNTGCVLAGGTAVNHSNNCNQTGCN